MGADVVAARRGNRSPGAMLRPASDHRLVEDVHAGSERAFEVLFTRHHRPVLAFCRHMLGSREEAEDVVQQTFLIAYREIARGEQPRSLRPWLYMIARHRCLSALRARRPRSLGDVPERGADNLLAQVTTREDLRAILADVARLPDDQRAALVLAELGDTSHEEIARIVGCPREKVKALVFQARSSLTAERTAREISCAEVQEQLDTLRGGALRRRVLRRHVHDCPGCRAFRDRIRAERRHSGLLLPAAPVLALKRAVLGALFGSGGGGAGGAALTAGTLSAAGLAVTAVVALSIPAGPFAGDVPASRDGGDPARPAASARTPGQRAAPANAWAPRVGTERTASRGVPERRHANARRSDPTQLDARPAQATANADDARPAASEQPAARDAADKANSAEPVTPPNSVKPSEPPAGDLQLQPARPAKPPKPPRANREVTPHGPPKPNRPLAPAKPPNANGQIAPGKPPKPPAHASPAKPDRQDQAPPESAPAPSPSAQPSPGGAHPPGGRGEDGFGAGGPPQGGPPGG